MTANPVLAEVIRSGFTESFHRGILIALVSCRFGMRIEPNTESLGVGTTRSVVTSITVVILADAVFAIIFADVGISIMG